MCWSWWSSWRAILRPCWSATARARGRCGSTLFRVDGETVEAEIRLAAASREAGHIVKLFSLKLDALADDYDAGFGFEAARLDVTAAERMAPSQTGLADDSEAAREAKKLSLLIDRLGSRLGIENVLRASPCDTHIPERAMVLHPAAQYETQPWEEAPMRPLLMLPCAEPAEVTALLPEGPPLQFPWRGVRYATAHAEGPERIRPEWWRDGRARARDYYTVEDEDGRRFWMYRDGPYGARRDAALVRAWGLCMSDYAELCVTTNFSFLRGASHAEELVERRRRIWALPPSASPTATPSPAWCAPMSWPRSAGVKLLIGVRLVTMDGFEAIAYPTDRAAYGRLCRLLTRGNRRAKKGECHLRWTTSSNLAKGRFSSRCRRAPRPSPTLAAAAHRGASGWAQPFFMAIAPAASGRDWRRWRARSACRSSRTTMCIITCPNGRCCRMC